MVLNYSRSLAEDFAGEQPRWGPWWPGSLGSQMGAVLSPREHVALSEDIFGYPAGALPLAVSDGGQGSRPPPDSAQDSPRLRVGTLLCCPL